MTTPDQARAISAGREIRDGSRAERCDNCSIWKPLSSLRVMGWCEHDRPMPNVRPVMILLGRLPDDQVTAYNQVCDAFAILQEQSNAE